MLPQSFLDRMKELLGESYADFSIAIEQPSVRALRVNKTKSDVQTVKAAFGENLQEIPYASDGFIFNMDKIGNHPLHHGGAFYVQDPGAMATLNALDIEKGWRVADFCASPGGKSSQLSAYIGSEGVLLSNEINHARCKVLAGNLERLGCANAVVTNTDSETLASWFDAWFDLVLVDAPCSGEGMFRKYDQAKTEWSEENVLACAERQYGILQNAAKTVKCGGYLLYSTCTFSLEENERNVDKFLREHSNFHICDVKASLKAITADGIPFDGCEHPQDMLKARRFYPHIFPGEGQFICLMQKDMGEEDAQILYSSSMSERLSRADEQIVFSFLKNVLTADGYATVLKRGVFKFKDTVFLAQPHMPIPPTHVFLPSVALGTIVKGRMEPHHQFFMACGDLFARKACFSHDDDTVKRYLRGETFSCALADGYAVILADGASLGGIKVVNGTAKNHYPKGLRMP